VEADANRVRYARSLEANTLRRFVDPRRAYT
jgi:hypothetical protein